MALSGWRWLKRRCGLLWLLDGSAEWLLLARRLVGRLLPWRLRAISPKPAACTGITTCSPLL
jgi:hypothetical protein